MEESTQTPQVNYCPRHPRNQTNLRCGRCDELICADCMVQTPVGVRCPRCANIRRIPTYDVTKVFLIRAIVAGLLLAIVLGVVYVLVFRFLAPQLLALRFLHLLAFVGVGYAIGEGISLAVNRKRGRSLKIVAAVSLLFVYFILSFFGVADLTLFGLLAIGAAFYVAIIRF